MTGGDPGTRCDPAARGARSVWNVAGLLGEGAGAVRDFAVARPSSSHRDDDIDLAAPIDGRVHVSRTNRGLLVDADFTTVLATECVRCLRDITVPLAFEIHDEALPSIDIRTGKAGPAERGGRGGRGHRPDRPPRA